MHSHYPKDIEAEVIFFLPENGGRLGPIFSGFRPTFKYDDSAWDASLWWDNEEQDKPKGVPIKVFFAFVSPEAHLGKLIPEKTFELWDGKAIAKGRVIRVIELEESARKAQKLNS